MHSKRGGAKKRGLRIGKESKMPVNNGYISDWAEKCAWLMPSPIVSTVLHGSLSRGRPEDFIDKKEPTAVCSELLGVSEEEARESIIDVGRDDLTYFAIANKDDKGVCISGESLIVADDGTVLYANSSVSMSEHLDAFDKGIRTPLDTFWQY